MDTKHSYRPAYLKNLATFKLEDLIGKHIAIEIVVDKGCGDTSIMITHARDLKTGTIYILDTKEVPNESK